jgi:hypothetical protein
MSKSTIYSFFEGYLVSSTIIFSLKSSSDVLTL